MVNAAQDNTRWVAVTGSDQFDKFFQRMARLSAGGNGCGGWSFLNYHLQQHQPPWCTGDLQLQTVNLLLHKVDH